MSLTTIKSKIQLTVKSGMVSIDKAPSSVETVIYDYDDYQIYTYHGEALIGTRELK